MSKLEAIPRSLLLNEVGVYLLRVHVENSHNNNTSCKSIPRFNNYMIFLKIIIRKINNKILRNIQCFPKHMEGRTPNKHIVKVCAKDFNIYLLKIRLIG